MNKLVTTLIIIAATGCASIGQKNYDDVIITTANDNAPTQTRCNLKNEEDAAETAPGQPAKIHRDGNPLNITCNNPTQTGSTNLQPEFATQYLVQDILLDVCTFSCLIDGMNNAFYDYPPTASVTLK